MVLKIEARKWVAVWYRCPTCGAQRGEPMLTPWRWRHRNAWQCSGVNCNGVAFAVVAYKWYTTFAIEPGISQTTIAGTLEKIGPFQVCSIVHPDIRAFKRWYRRRKAEKAEETRQYLERERHIEAEHRARREIQVVQSRAKQPVGQAGDFDPFLDEGELP
ncbi:MAG: hypothetical protein ACRDHW_00480 [Ktedonobacteraceae bacterium]